MLSRINDEYRAKVMPFCRQALTDRFPFALGSPADVSLGDMARLFAAGGLFDQFAEQQLAPFVDMAKRPWQWLQPIGSSNGRSRRSSWPGGCATACSPAVPVPRAGFTLKPAGLDAGSGKVVLDLDGQQVTYAHGPIQPTHFDWPGPSGSRLVRLTFVPVGGGTPAIVTKEGPLGLVSPAARGGPERRRVSPTASASPSVSGRTAPASICWRTASTTRSISTCSSGSAARAGSSHGRGHPRQAAHQRRFRAPRGCRPSWPSRSTPGWRRRWPRSRDALGEGWLETYLTAPVWRFALAAGCCGPAAAGIWLPSVDRVGRYYPLRAGVPARGAPPPATLPWAAQRVVRSASKNWPWPRWGTS